MLGVLVIAAAAVVMCAIAAAATLAAGSLVIMAFLSLTGLAARLFPKRPTRVLTLNDLRVSSPAPERWRF